MKFVHFVKDDEFTEIRQFREQMEQLYDIKVELFASDFKKEI